MHNCCYKTSRSRPGPLVATWTLNARIVRSNESLLVLVVALRLTKREPSLSSHTLSRTDLFDSLLESVLRDHLQSAPRPPRLAFADRPQLTALALVGNRTD